MIPLAVKWGVDHSHPVTGIVDQEGLGVFGAVAHYILARPIGVVERPCARACLRGCIGSGVCVRERDEGHLFFTVLIEVAVQCFH